ncbi:sulfhydryl oxidase 1-like protein [Leptotrombidium deliense]|uniref:Sulfhydryl oxidase 1-like protein n=1 Tax=Leptotrombidium deliense TaxID=299467 RepID=A0A443SW24_9ACAR|nr:sulfhydryl oxidase 1-like protein [Leptotrombidium deliense]
MHLLFNFMLPEIVGWNSVVQLAVVNCADYTNVDLCAYFGVPGFPTIRFFAPFSRKRDLGLNVELHERTSEGLIEKCALLIRNYSDHHVLPLEWPQLKAVKEIDFDVADDKRPVLVIAEKNDSLIGTEVILDLSSFDDYITVYRTIANSSTTDSLPVVKRVFKSGKSELVYSEKIGNISKMNAYELKKEIVRKIREVYLTDVWPVSNLDDKVNIATTTKAPTVVKEYKVVAVDVTDLYNALHYTLYQEITLKKRLNTTQIEALHQFLIAIDNHFPFRESKGEQLSRFYERSPVLWLWWAHNQVNTRLAGDESEDPSHPKIQFPPLSACSDCRNKGKSLKWNQKRVLDYLSSHYNFSSSHL